MSGMGSGRRRTRCCCRRRRAALLVAPTLQRVAGGTLRRILPGPACRCHLVVRVAGLLWGWSSDVPVSVLALLRSGLLIPPAVAWGDVCGGALGQRPRWARCRPPGRRCCGWVARLRIGRFCVQLLWQCLVMVAQILVLVALLRVGWFCVQLFCCCSVLPRWRRFAFYLCRCGSMKRAEWIVVVVIVVVFDVPLFEA